MLTTGLLLCHLGSLSGEARRLHARSYFEELLQKGWVPPEKVRHRLAGLQAKALGPCSLAVLLGPRNRFGATYFAIFLRRADAISHQPVILGLHNQGQYPGYNWIEIISFSPGVSSDSDDFTLNGGLKRRLFQYLADLIPPGGHIMMEYDSPEQQDTARSLALGIPPVATALGYLLYTIGCGVAYKDWYFAESGAEGPRKLQGFKALNLEHLEVSRQNMVVLLKDFLKGSSSSQNGLVKTARKRARAVLNELGRNAG